MALIDLINSGNYASPQEALIALTTASIEIKDRQLWTWAGIESLTDEETADNLEKFLVENGKTRWISQLGGTGLLLSDPKVQAMLISLIPLIPGCSKLAEQGISYKTPLQAANLAVPTIEEVEEAFAAVQAELAKEAIRTRLDVAYNQIGTSEEAEAIAELRAIADELEG